jgi:hypothetical protein
MPDVDDVLIRGVTAGGRARAVDALDEARHLHSAGFAGPTFVWAVRAAEVLMRDFVLTPHFLLEGLAWEEAWRKGSKILGASNWTKAFATADQWYGPFDEPRTTDDRNAWDTWVKDAIRTRGAIIHGHAVHSPTLDESAGAIAFVDRMISWWSQRLVTSDRHPAGHDFREAMQAARDALDAGGSPQD